MIVLPLLKMFATALTIGSGGSGGVFAPSMVIGGLLGAGAGTLCHHFAPDVVTTPAAFILVGMAGFFAGVAKVPVSSLVMVSEMTEGYGLLVPLMLTTSVSFLLSPRSVSIYSKQVDARVDSPAHRGEFYLNVLQRLTVASVLSAPDRTKPVLFHSDTPVEEIAAAAGTARQIIFPVVSADGKNVIGIIDLSDVAILLAIPYLAGGLVLAEDLSTTRFEIIHADETLASALKKLRSTPLEGLPVLPPEGGPVTGILDRRDIGNAYYDYVHQESTS